MTDVYTDTYFDIYGASGVPDEIYTVLPFGLEDPTTFDEAIRHPVTQITRRVDIYEADGVTPYYTNAPLIGGSVSVDETRAERRSVDLSLYAEEGDDLLIHHPDGLWYDKVFKVYRGVTTPDLTFEEQIGEFLVDTIAVSNFPGTVSMSGRDYTKKLQTSKFPQATSFASGQAPETIIKTIATNGGITKFIFPTTGKTTGKEFVFDRGVERIEAINEIATAYGLEAFFNAQGYMVLRERRDPVTSPLSYTFQTGETGQLAKWSKKTTDTRIYNHVVVVGQRADQTTVTAEALNNEPSSPTNIAKLGDRLYQYVSSFISTVEQAQDVADKFLAVHALEQFDIDFESLVIPWLEAGDIIGFVDPDPAPGDPTRFLLSNFTIPLDLTLMAATGRRVTNVG